MYAEDFLIERTETLIDIGIPKNMAVFMTQSLGLKNEFKLRRIHNFGLLKQAVRFEANNAILKNNDGTWSIIWVKDPSWYSNGKLKFPMMRKTNFSDGNQISKIPDLIQTREFGKIFRSAEKVWVFDRRVIDRHQEDYEKEWKEETRLEPEHFSAYNYLKVFIPWYKNEYRRWLKKSLRELEKAVRTRDFDAVEKYNSFARLVDLVLQDKNMNSLQLEPGSRHGAWDGDRSDKYSINNIISRIEKEQNKGVEFDENPDVETRAQYKRILRQEVVKIFKGEIVPEISKEFKQIRRDLLQTRQESN